MYIDNQQIFSCWDIGSCNHTLSGYNSISQTRVLFDLCFGGRITSFPPLIKHKHLYASWCTSNHVIVYTVPKYTPGISVCEYNALICITHWSRVLHSCINKLGHHWLRQCLVACLVPSYYHNNVVIPFIATTPLQIFVHATTDQQSWHVQTFVGIIVLKLRWEQPKIPSSLNCDRNIFSAICSWKDEIWSSMMTSSNGNIFRVTDHLCGEFTGPRWIPSTKASDAEFWYILWSASE